MTEAAVDLCREENPLLPTKMYCVSIWSVMLFGLVIISVDSWIFGKRFQRMNQPRRSSKHVYLPGMARGGETDGGRTLQGCSKIRIIQRNDSLVQSCDKQILAKVEWQPSGPSSAHFLLLGVDEVITPNGEGTEVVEARLYFGLDSVAGSVSVLVGRNMNSQQKVGNRVSRLQGENCFFVDVTQWLAEEVKVGRVSELDVDVSFNCPRMLHHGRCGTVIQPFLVLATNTPGCAMEGDLRTLSAEWGN